MENRYRAVVKPPPVIRVHTDGENHVCLKS